MKTFHQSGKRALASSGGHCLGMTMAEVLADAEAELVMTGTSQIKWRLLYNSIDFKDIKYKDINLKSLMKTQFGDI